MVRDRESGRLTPELIAGLRPPSNWALSPRGDQVAFTMESGEAQQIFRMPATGGWPLCITPELKRFGRPSWSPDGRRLVSVAGNALYGMDANGAGQKRLHEHPSGISEPSWSPDGATIAVRSRERGWDQIWVVPFDGGVARQLTTAPADNQGLQWSPGARALAYTSIRHDLRERHVYTVDAASGEERNITAANPCYHAAATWAPFGARLAYLSERDGYLHLHLRWLNGGEERQITAGPWEDGGLYGQAPQQLCWSSEGDQIAFLRNRDGKLDVMVIGADGETLRRVSPGDGNWAIVGWLPYGEHLLATFDSPLQPPDLWRLSTSGGAAVQLTFSAGGFRRESLVTPQRLTYSARDGTSISGYLYRPAAALSGARCPAIVVAHGGPSSQFTFAWRPIFQFLAQEGYAVFGPDFRGSTGYGRAFREANFGEWGNADLWDVVDAAEHLRTLDWIDAERIGVYGGSYGGYLVLCALARSPATFRCGIDLYGDSEIAESYRHGDRLGRLDLERQMGSPEQRREAYQRGSPVHEAERIEAPVLVLHGREDKRVVPLMSELMIEALTIEGKYFEQAFYAGEGHGFQRPANKQDSIERTLKFLKRHLKGEVDDG